MNVMYNELLEMDLPEGVTLIGFADDVAMAVVDRDEEMLMNKANTALRLITRWMESRQLQLAPEKTEAVLLTPRRKITPIHFEIQGTVVNLSDAIKYLGVWLDRKLNFAKHVEETITKAQKTVTALSCLMPNIGGPRASKRKLMSSVIHSQILYAAPAWHAVTENKSLIQKLSRVQRLMSIRICSAYKTVSTEGVGVIAGNPPIDLLIKERLETYIGESKEVARENLLRIWQQKWTNGKYGRWTYRLIPNIERWIKRPTGEVDYYMTQALSGHGCFQKYLHSRRRAETESCRYCGQQDDAEHTLFACSRWNEIRTNYEQQTGRPFNVPNVSENLTSSEDEWKTVYRTVREIIETKEREDRENR